MRHAGFRVLRRGVDARFALIIAVAALLAAGAAALAGQQALAQSGNNTNPRVHATPLRNGVAVDERVIDELGGTALTHVELRLGSGNNGQTRATYQDFGSVELWLEERPGSALHDTQAHRLWYYSGGANAGQRLTLCGGGATRRCQLLKAEWKMLAGQSGVTSGQEATTNVEPIRLAFNIPTTITAGTIRLGVVHYSQFATRNTGGGSQWGPHSDWTVLTYGANITPVDDQDRPFWVRNSLTDSTRNRSFQYPFAAGQLSHVRLNAGLATALGDSRDTITYAQFTSVALKLEDSSSPTALNSNIGAHQNFFTTTDGANLSACGTSGNACVIDKAEWQALAGQTGAAGTVVVKPIRIAIKVPREFPVGTAYNGASVKLEAELTGTDIRVADREATFKRLSAHITRLQTAKRETAANGRRVVTVVEPNANSDVADGDHAAKECTAANLQAGGSPMTDCYRNIEVGEGVYLENILRVGGAADNTGSSTATTRTNDEWLRADAARHGAIFDRVQVQATVEAGTPPAPVPGGGVVAISTLCPIGSSNDPEHTSALGNVPRSRTTEGLATCTYRYNGATYWGGKGIEFFPTASAGTVVTITLSYHKGEDDDSTANVDESLVARDTLPITVAAAADNTDTGNRGSSWDESDVVAQLGQRSREDSLVLLIGHRRNRGIPEFWGGLTSPTGPGTIKGATYATVSSTAAVALTVPAGGGRLSLLGTDKSCTAGSSACTLTLTRNDLKQAALRGGPNPDLTLPTPQGMERRAATVADIADDTPYWPARLHFEHATAQDVTISGVLTLADDTTTSNFMYVAQGAAASPGASIVAWLPEDADDTLAPSQTTKVAIGYKVPAAASGVVSNPTGELFGAEDDAWRIWNPTPQFYEITGYTGVDPRPTVELITGASASPLPVSMWNSYLQLTGPAVWADTGGRRLRLDRTAYTYYKCVSEASRTGNEGDTGRICYITDASGNAPSVSIASDASADISVIAGDVPIWTMFGQVAPNASHSGGPNDSYFRAMNAHSSERFDVFGSAPFKVESIKQLSSIALGRKPGADGVVPTTPVRIGSSSDVRLSLLNANGRPSQLSAVSAITVTVIGGGTLTGQGCTNATSCTISTRSGGDLAAAAAANPAIVAAIDLAYNAPTRPGSASIRATVVGTDGTTYTESVDLTVSGSARELAVGGTLLRVHSSATADDDRDKIRIPITAQDANGNAARMPQNAAATVRGVGGAALPSGSHTATVTCTNESRLSCHIEIVVTATASQPLASGAYTATVTGTGLAETEASFAVGGPAETLAISVPDTLPGLAETFTATVSVVDKAGVPVADGSWVVFETAATGGGAPSAVVTSPGAEDVDHDGDPETAAVSQRRAKTKNGEVSASVTVVGNGITVLTATANNKQDSKPLDTRAAAAPEAIRTGPVLVYSVQSGEATTSSWATYKGAAATTADELLDHAEAPAAASIVWLWNGVKWIRYGEVDGTPLPGSQRFFILPDDTVWFGD